MMCCHHGVHLLDADQEVPPALSTAMMKFRYQLPACLPACSFAGRPALLPACRAAFYLLAIVFALVAALHPLEAACGLY